MVINKVKFKAFLKQRIKDMSWATKYKVTCDDMIPLDSVLKMVNEIIDEYAKGKKN